MMHSVELTLQQQPEVLERVLRVARHRGFSIVKMNMNINEDGTVKLVFDVKSERVIELLTHQLNKLIDVIDCQVAVLPAAVATNTPILATAAQTATPTKNTVQA
ncbi:acetolactate synthase 2 small subunit [Shewanella donghaensis]|uniref:acetolactate synthase 2 small subunit n=1 Tax=Shewanella donghaensis TaxID=238836 RepID=UPI001182C9BC|nr:acetolactate synthase 2 small subunit [Shewanella donghaensis]